MSKNLNVEFEEFIRKNKKLITSIILIAVGIGGLISLVMTYNMLHLEFPDMTSDPFFIGFGIVSGIIGFIGLIIMLGEYAKACGFGGSQ